MAAKQTLANSLVPIAKSGDAARDQSLKPFSKVLQMVDNLSTDIMHQMPYENITGKSEPRYTWFLDSLNSNDGRPAGDDDRAVAYGAEVAPTGVKNPEQRANYPQSEYVSWSVSDEGEKAARWHIGSRRAREMMKKRIELRVGQEKQLLNNNQASAEPTTANGNVAKTATLEAMIETRAEVGDKAGRTTLGTTGGWNAATGMFVARTRSSDDGKVEFSLADTADLIDASWEALSEPGRSKMMCLSLKGKKKFNSFSDEGIAPFRTQIDETGAPKLALTVSGFNTEGGTIVVKACKRMQGNSNIFVVDPKRVKLFGYFRNVIRTLGRKGNSVEKYLTTNWGVSLPTEAGMVALYDRDFD